MNWLTPISSLVSNLPSLDAALIILLVTTIVGAVGLLLAVKLREDPITRSFVLRSTVIAMLAASASYLCLTLLVPITWQPKIVTSSELAMPVSAFIHPVEWELSDPSVQPVAPAPPSSPPSSLVYPEPIDVWVMVNAGIWSVWIAGALLLIVRLLVGRIIIARLRRRALPISRPGFDELYRSACAPLEFSDSSFPLVLSTADIHGPFATGVLRPLIFLPEEHVSGDTDAELAAILTHELTHIRNQDQLFQIIGQLMCAVAWFQPLVWLLAHALEDSAEDRCDIEVMVSNCSERRVYANLLVRIAQGRVERLTESVAGLGLAPRRSVLARRVEQILSGIGSNLKRVSRVAQTAVTVVLALVVVSLLALCAVRYDPAHAASSPRLAKQPPANEQLKPLWQPTTIYLNQFQYAKQHGWSVGPVMINDGPRLIKPQAETGQAAPANERAASESLAIAAERMDKRYTSPLPESDLQSLKQILASRPHFAPAEYLISFWYRENGEPRQAQSRYDQSLADAPAIIAGRVQLADGTPVPRYQFVPFVQSYESWDSSGSDQQAIAMPVRTDSFGCYYLPVTDRIVNTLGEMWYGQGAQEPTERNTPVADMSLNFGTFALSKYTTNDRVGVVEPLILRPKLALTLNGVAASHSPNAPGSFNHPLALTGNSALLTWQPVAGASRYKVQIGESTALGSGQHSLNRLLHMSNSALDWNGATATSLSLDLDTSAPGYLAGRVYQVEVIALSVIHTSLVNGVNVVTTSNVIYFEVPNGLKSLPLTRKIVQSLAGSDATVKSIQSSPAGATVIIDRPHQEDDHVWADRNLFGYRTTSIDFTTSSMFNTVTTTTITMMP